MTRYALITGASSGIGLALAEALARRGRSLILVARQRDQLESIAIELTQRFGVEVLFRACDLGEPLRLSGFLLELEEGERQIDLLVNCAGMGTSGPFLAQDWMTEQDLIEVNILALTRMCHALGNAMALHGGGQILNVASIRRIPTRPVDEQLLRQQSLCIALLRRSARRIENLRHQGLGAVPRPDAHGLLRHGTNGHRQARAQRALDEPGRSGALHRARPGKNQAIIIPGRRNRWLAFSPRLSPRWLTRKLAGAINKAYCPR